MSRGAVGHEYIEVIFKQKHTENRVKDWWVDEATVARARGKLTLCSCRSQSSVFAELVFVATS